MELARLRAKIEQGEYEVPAEEVAEALIGWISPTGPSPERPADAGRGPLPPSERS